MDKGRRPIRAVLFDMDGLLIDSERIYTEVVNEVLRPYGKKQTWEIKAKLMGKPEKEATRTHNVFNTSCASFMSVATKSGKCRRYAARVQQ